MNKRLERAIQYGLPALQQYKRDLTETRPICPPHQIWLCPNCDTLHSKTDVDPDNYGCDCGWHGDRHELCRGDLSCLTTT